MNNKIFYLILPNIRSRFNVGSIFRTADAAGIDKIFLTGITPAPPHPKIDKVALGAEKNVTFEKISQTNRLLKKLTKLGFQIIALEQSNKSIPYTQLKPKFPIALVVGNEVKGINNSIIKNCHEIIHIPMHGKKESLNVSVALGITIFNIINK